MPGVPPPESAADVTPTPLPPPQPPPAAPPARLAFGRLRGRDPVRPGDRFRQGRPDPRRPRWPFRPQRPMALAVNHRRRPTAACLRPAAPGTADVRQEKP